MEIIYSDKPSGNVIKQPYAIVWQHFSEALSSLNGFTIVDGEGKIPFLVYGEALEKLQNSSQAVFDEQMLSEAMVFFWEDKKLDWSEINRTTWKKLLGYICKKQGFSESTGFIVLTAEKLRQQLGFYVSSRVLQAAVAIAPRNSKIRTTLVIDTFLSHRNDLDRFAWRELSDLLADINLNNITPEEGETIVMLGLCSMYYLGEKKTDIKYYLNKFIYMMVYDMGYRQLVKGVLDEDLLEEDIFAAVEDYALRKMTKNA